MTDESVTVKVEALNDTGDRRFVYGVGDDTNEAVQNALNDLRLETQDDSFVMTEWSAA